LPPGTIIALGPDLSYRIEGTGRIGRILLITELERELRRTAGPATSGSSASPEYSHDRPNESTPRDFPEKWKSAAVDGGEEKDRR
jgi:hypothetical protein